MDKQPITVLKKLFEAGELSEELVTYLRADDRKGVQKLIKTYENQKRKEEMLEKNFMDMCYYEERGYASGCEYIAGIDEAGRGPLAGPVVAAAVILPRNFKLLGLNDSKQLNEATRTKFFNIIKEQAVSYGISIIGSQKIDEINIFEATKLAMHDAINQLNLKPNHILIDAVELRGLSCSSESITKGDAKSISIAAASILAKVTRDEMMKELHSEYPNYGFNSNVGYGTKHHIDSLMEHGVSPYHRRSFAPVRNAVHY
ncbi:ribonuclease HII [Virgibacillus natechei]|uniref:Ribonuclease HII n=1 Tax=Virgibacillus natechei TaxID=1216297 RepID=A0ABS4IB19_9BACI|nr:ribonuclease HII [Virgibacillus natechei]MBP1968119.1 ribonuclease HII [Virgibacillus natechei]UZD14602.1 ribonuclease HII [Virgibacillus natechei]